MHVRGEYAAYGSWGRDIAVMRLHNLSYASPEWTFGSFGWRSMGYESDCPDYTIHRIGFSGDSPYDGVRVTYSKSSIAGCFAGSVYHYCDTWGGDSGAGLYRKSGDSRVMRLVHRGWVRGSSGDVWRNVAARVTSGVFRWTCDIMEDDGVSICP